MPRDTKLSGHTPSGGLRLDIEGLRALAVGIVLLYHAGWVGLGTVAGLELGLSGGYAGVDVFFVISGYLITSLLLREMKRSGTISIANFYARRARRLLPAASVVLVFTAVAGWIILPLTQVANLAKDLAAATLYAVNWTLAFRSVDYLAEDAAVSPVQHYWSLSVEEQFYVVWPLLILLVLWLARRARFNPKRFLGGVLVVIFIASLAYSIIHTSNDPATAYFYTTTRCWELAIGALTAFAAARASHLPRMASQVGSLVGLLMIIWATLVFDHTTPWPGSAALIPTLGTAMVITAGCAPHNTLAKRLLGVRPMVWIGGLSYSIYLWHWPLIVFSRTLWPDIRLRHLAIVAVLSVILAWATKRAVEDPVRFSKSLSASPWRAIVAGMTLMSLTLVSAALVWRTVPSLDAPEETVGATTLIADPSASTWQVTDEPEKAINGSAPVYPPPALATDDVPSYYNDGCQVQVGDAQVRRNCSYGDPNGDRVLAVLGDSKAGQWMSSFDAIAKREGMRLDLYLKSACPFSYAASGEPECSQFAHNVTQVLKEPDRKPDLIVTSAMRAQNAEQVDGITSALSDLADLGSPIVILDDTQWPTTAPVYECMVKNPDNYSRCAYPREPSKASAGLKKIAEQGNHTFVTLNDWICPEKTASACPAAIGETTIWRQGSHITDSYARSLTPILHRMLSQAGLTTTPVKEITLAVPPK